jgi:hypothetical protein
MDGSRFPLEHPAEKLTPLSLEAQSLLDCTGRRVSNTLLAQSAYEEKQVRRFQFLGQFKLS